MSVIARVLITTQWSISQFTKSKLISISFGSAQNPHEHVVLSVPEKRLSFLING
jgi:hypothetical protein